MNTINMRSEPDRPLYQSASKVVFIMLSLTACVAFLLGRLPVDQFMLLAIGASSFYFSHKGEPQNSHYAGK